MRRDTREIRSVDLMPLDVLDHKVDDELHMNVSFNELKERVYSKGKMEIESCVCVLRKEVDRSLTSSHNLFSPFCHHRRHRTTGQGRVASFGAQVP